MIESTLVIEISCDLCDAQIDEHILVTESPFNVAVAERFAWTSAIEEGWGQYEKGGRLYPHICPKCTQEKAAIHKSQIPIPQSQMEVYE